MAWLGGPALIGLTLYALPISVKALSLALLTAASAFAVGGVVGFLFGIPRSVPSDPSNTADGSQQRPRFEANSNLVQISDWLTKVLVGVGLVQVHQVSSSVGHLAAGLAEGLGGDPYGEPIAVTLLISFSITGFLSGYLYTSLRLQNALELVPLIERLVKRRSDKESNALNLVRQQLTPGTDKPSLSTLTKALQAAPPGIRTQAFFLARKQRFEDWREATDQEKREFSGLGIPIFEALIANDPDGDYHRTRAELGYALLDKQPPDYGAAKAAFDKAIELRPPEFANRMPRYEINRAYCEIMLDRDFAAGKPSLDHVVDVVCPDLEAVSSLKGIGKKVRKAILKWLKTNAGADATQADRVKGLQARLRS